ncbi:MAG: hypothetical protein WDO71_25000 [Bacteroidota bacterium]
MPTRDGKFRLIFGWAGMRGVGFAGCCIIYPCSYQWRRTFPLPQPYTSLLTFIVILVTLVFQGLTLPWVIRKLNPTIKPDTIPET